MRDWRARVLAAAAIVVTMLVLVVVAACADSEPIWPTYHYDCSRAGQNKNSLDITNPASLNLIWAFPRNVGKVVDEANAIVDNETAGFFSATGDWNADLESDEAYEVLFLWSGAISREETGKTASTAIWKFPSTTLRGGTEPLPGGTYQIMVWVPSAYQKDTDSEGKPLHHNTSRAEYTVHDDNGDTTIIFDQRNGGYWQLLTTRAFSFSNPSAGNYTVTLSNLTSDTKESIDADHTIVVADAIKFVPSTGMEIYSSPASAVLKDATINWTYPGGIEPGDSPGNGTWTGNLHTVFVGTVEPFLGGNSSAPDTGGIYCISSVTPQNWGLGDVRRKYIDPNNPSAGVTDEWKEAWALSQMLGKPIWHYPRSASERLAAGAELEGPIEGGIYSSPVVVPTGRGAHPLLCIVTAADRQVYAFDAESGELVWKGPGVTLSEGSPAGWTPEGPREAFGGQFHWAMCVDGSGTPQTVTWNFDQDDKRVKSQPNGVEGLSYSVYAWMPPVTASDPPRSRDATYTITYASVSNPSATVTVKVDQSSAGNQARWVKLGSSLFNVSSVELNNVTAFGDDVGNRCVVADAVMIVPDTVEAFTYSSPVVDIAGAWKLADGSAQLASTVFATTAAGRIISFDLAGSGDGIARVNWYYPRVRTTLRGSGQNDADAPPLGTIGATPAYDDQDNGRLFIATTGETVFNVEGPPTTAGKVVCIENVKDTPAQQWVFPDNEEEDPAGFTSSPALDSNNNQLFIGSTSGVFYCLRTEATASDRVRWKYPADTGTSVTALPLGAFRYSTPAVADDSQGMHRVWVGSTDGHVYSFGATTNTADPGYGQRLRVEYDDQGNFKRYVGAWYNEPNVMFPVQGSVALDGTNGGSKRMVMYFGDMQDQGVLYWYDATNGVSTWDFMGEVYKGWRTEGQLFSSPNVTNIVIGSSMGSTVESSYVYVGGSDGRIYAFSPDGGAWGGEWAGGDWPFSGHPNDRSQMERQLSPVEDIQFDIFERPFYEKSQNENPEPKTGSDLLMTTPWPTDWIVSEKMKQPTGLTKFTLDEINAKLRDEAMKQRNAVFAKTTRLGTGADSAIYFEWGETLYLILWNLPDMATLYGGTDTNEAAKRANIRFNLANTSAGSSAGSQLRLSSNCRVLKEYTVLSTTAHTRTTSDNTTYTYYDPLRPTGETDPVKQTQEVKRCYALAQIDIRGTGSRPPSPGPGWVLTAEVRQKTGGLTGQETVIQKTIPLARIKAGTNGPEPVLVPIKPDPNSPAVGKDYKPQLLGINNPLAIRDDGDKMGRGVMQLAWPGTNFLVTASTRQDPAAHFNGNAQLVVNAPDDVGYDTSVMPTLNLNIPDTSVGVNGRPVSHGTNSREGWLGVMDRSATGLSDIPGTNPRRSLTLDRFRVSAGDFAWRGGEKAIADSGGTLFPWELGVGSVDYPNIYTRSQSYRKQSDDADPSKLNTSLPPIIPATPGVYEGSTLRPDTVYISAEVPRFQPANLTGYSRTMQAYIDSDGDQHWDSGDSVYGRPTTYQEAYRKFRAFLTVAPDPRIEVEEQLVDVGHAPHGLGEGFDFVPYNTEPDVRQWFKKINIKNAGNVNLYNMQVGKNLPLYLLKDAVGIGRSEAAIPRIPGTEIRSSLDLGIPGPLSVFNQEPFITLDPNKTRRLPLNYTLTKARVGDPDPSFLTIPDRRKWTADYSFTPAWGMGKVYTTDAAADALMATGWATTLEDAKAKLPFPVEVSVAVPLSQQIGTYVVPFVGVGGQFAGSYAVADPSFGLKVTVQENRLTGDRSPGVLAQVDSGPLPKVGDATPAAYRDRNTGSVHLFWSSNRIADRALQGNYPDWNDPSDPKHQVFANAPWFIYESTLQWDPVAGWLRPIDASKNPLPQWWGFPDGTPFLPSFGAAEQWPALIAAAPGARVMDWVSDSGKGLQSVSHSSPVIAENEDLRRDDPNSATGLTWLGWIGTANIKNPDGKVTQEHRFFYTDITSGDITFANAHVFSIEQEPTSDKRYPSLSVFNRPNGKPRMWAFWQGGDNGRWSIYYSVNDSQPDFPTRSPGNGASLWSQDTKLRTPDCLSSVSSPNAVHRVLWQDLRGFEAGGLQKGSLGPPTAGEQGGGGGSGSDRKDLFDMVYAGVSKYSQTPDILLSRYAAVAPNDSLRAGEPGRVAQPMPRVFAEKLQRDPKFAYFTSRHLAWMRPSRAVYDNVKRLAAPPDIDLLLNDHVGRDAHIKHMSDLDGFFRNLPADKSVLINASLYNMPYIWVRLPANYGGDSTITDGTIVSATSGVIPDLDDASGVCTYKYPAGSPADRILGQMLVDYSAGIVRFTKPLEEIKRDDGTVAVPEVYADYTPLTWRLTTDAGVDNSPRAFIERTPMTRPANPGLAEDWVDSPNRDVDRLWVLWRRAGSGVNSSTIYWKTYRIGIDLTSFRNPDGSPKFPPIPITWRNSAGGGGTRYIDTGGVTVTGALGPWELDSTGTRIYFSQVDERYASLIKSGTAAFFTNPAPPTDVAAQNAGYWEPKPIVIEYNDADGNKQTVKAFDVSWLEESSEQSLFGFVGDSSVNEGSVYAFADPSPEYWQPTTGGGTWNPFSSSKIWVFWTSTRAGNSDLCWATLTPNFGPR